MYYNKCPYCGANLDPNEQCDCIKVKKELEDKYKEVLMTDDTGQLTLKEVCA